MTFRRIVLNGLVHHGFSLEMAQRLERVLYRQGHTNLARYANLRTLPQRTSQLLILASRNRRCFEVKKRPRDEECTRQIKRLNSTSMSNSEMKCKSKSSDWLLSPELGHEDLTLLVYSFLSYKDQIRGREINSTFHASLLSSVTHLRIRACHGLKLRLFPRLRHVRILIDSCVCKADVPRLHPKVQMLAHLKIESHVVSACQANLVAQLVQHLPSCQVDLKKNFLGDSMAIKAVQVGLETSEFILLGNAISDVGKRQLSLDQIRKTRTIQV